MAGENKEFILDFQIKDLIQNIALTNDSIADLAEQQKLLKKSSIELGVEIQKKSALMKKAEEGNKTNTASYAKLKQEVEALKKVKKLSNQQRQRQLVETTRLLKTKRKEERLNMNVVQAHAEKEKSNLSIIKQTNGSIDQISAALANNRALYRSLTPEQRANVEIGGELIKVINQQDEEYKKLNNEMGVTQVNVGNYKEEIKKAFEESFNLKNGITSLLGSFGALIPLLWTSVKGLKSYVANSRIMAWATGTTSKALKLFRLALIGTGIGAIVVLIGTLVTAFMAVKSAMSRNEKTANKVKRVFAGITGVFNGILKILEPLGEYLINNLVEGFETVGKIADKTMGLLAKGLALIGWDSGAKKVEKYHKEMKEGVKVAQELADAEEKLAKAERVAEKTKLDYQKRAEKFRQIRDDENLTIKERIKANDDLGKVLKEQLNEELKIAQLALDAANLRVQAEGKTKEALDQQAEAKTRIADIQERITGQESEQLTNKVSLQKEAREKQAEALNKQKEAQEKAIKHQQRLLDFYILTSNKEKKGLKEKQQLAEEVHKRELKLIEQREKVALKYAKNDQEREDIKLNAQIEQAESRQKLLETQTALALENATKELEIYTMNNEHILNSKGKLNAELLAQQKKYLDEKAKLQIEALKEEKLTEEEFVAKKAQIERERDNAKQERDTAYTEQKKADKQKEFEEKKTQLQIDNELEIQALKDKNTWEFEIQQKKAEQEMEMKLLENENSALTTEQKEQRETLIKTQYAEQQKQIEETKNKFKLDVASQTLGNLATILGQESEAGKAVAVAQATIDTYQAATAAYKAMAGIPVVGPALGAIAAAAAVAAGIANVKKITATKKPDIKKAAKGITLKGNSHANGGVGLYDADGNKVVEAEGGENVYAITNKKASSMINERGILGTLSYINQQIGGGIPLVKPVNYASMGGLVQSNIKTSTNVNKVVDAFEQRENTLRVINIAEDTVSIANESIRVENEANF